MKRLAIILFVFTAYALEGHAQTIAENAIGLRLGDSDGFGTEISYQRALGDNNRLEVDFGWRNSKNFDAFRLTGLYQWVWNLDGGFNWYVGAGGGLAQVDFDDNFDRFDDDSETYLYAAGDIGIEYNFDFPLLLSLDFRPEIGFGDYNDDVDFDIALGIRYQF
ncbi:MAG: hypothetical protein CMC08_09960 [Flavobacteriaceae bacterium]|nr:hypothetical protein [Flavobacteriaceae bacterium]|tara:strand:- start:1482 stop:1970 length:489 start_codon:yes stop_codon:yes gene_type:complete